MNDWARLRNAAWLTLGLHLVAGLAMLVLLRPGLETNPSPEDRMRYLAGQTAPWLLGWLTWNLAALAALYFAYSFARAHGRTAPLELAVLLTAAALAVHLAAEAVEMGLLPELARAGQVEIFVAFARGAVLLTGFVANSLYTLGAVVLAWSTRDAYPGWVWRAGLLVGAAGFALSGASLFGSVAGLFWSDAVLVPAIIAWQAGVALTAGRKA